ncbi:unnamed protein product, partial [Iphiclides podalirius]
MVNALKVEEGKLITGKVSLFSTLLQIALRFGTSASGAAKQAIAQLVRPIDHAQSGPTPRPIDNTAARRSG